MLLFGNKVHDRPTSLRAVLKLAICTCRGRTIDEQFHAHVKAFLNVKFAIAKSMYPNMEPVLTALFKECTEDREELKNV